MPAHTSVASPRVDARQRPRRLVLLAATSSLFLGSLLVAQPRPTLLKDLNTQPAANGSSYPTGFATVGAWVYFAADDGVHGRELFRSAAGVGKPQIVADIMPGPYGSKPDNLTLVGSKLYFVAATGSAGRELWVTDGTAKGTFMVKDIPGEPSGSEPRDLAPIGNTLYFSANDATGRELWKTDGTAKGTVKVADPTPNGNSGVSQLFTVGKTLFFVAGSTTTGEELFKSDGTSQGTGLVVDLHPGSWAPGFPKSSNPRSFFALGNRLLFTATDPTFGDEPFVSDGTARGTQLLRDLFTGSSNRMPNGSSASGYCRVGKSVIFAAYRNPTKVGGPPVPGLFTTDGTPTGTKLLKDLPGTSVPSHMESDGQVMFARIDGHGTRTGVRIWRSDGTSKGTFELKAVTTGRGPYDLVVDNGRCYFGLDDGTTGLELWTSDGTAKGTRLVADTYPGRLGAVPTDLTVSPSGGILFAASDGKTGTEPWISKGTSATTRRLADIHNPVPKQTADSKFDYAWVETGGYAWYASNGLWRTDGTPQGTVSLTNSIFERPVWSGSNPSIASLGAKTFFAGISKGQAHLYQSDGTASGTTILKNVTWQQRAQPRGFVAMGGHVYFLAASRTTGFELWRTDGTSKGTTSIVDLFPKHNNNLSFEGPVVFRGALYFVASGQLFRSDGTAKGTSFVRFAFASKLTPAGSSLFFVSNTFPYGTELWKTDGTAKGTQLVRDIEPGFGSSAPRQLVAVGNKLMFAASTSASGHALWTSDGTMKGTRMIKDLDPSQKDPGVETFSSMTRFRNGVVFAGHNTKSRNAIWFSDGTTLGTRMIRDLSPGYSAYPAPRFFTPIGPRVFFLAAHSDGVDQIFVTDGTAAGTRRLSDFTGGTLWYPKGLFADRGRFFVFARHPIAGFEPHVLSPLTDAQAVGQGCGAMASRLASDPPVAGQTTTLTVRNAKASSSGLLVAGLQPVQPTHLGFGCELYVSPAAMVSVLAFRTDATGSFTARIATPALPQLRGLRLPFQAAVGPTSQSPLGLDLTNGLLVTLGY